MQIYEYQRDLLSKRMSTTAASFFSAMSSRLFVTTIMLPLESLRVRLGNSKENTSLKGTRGLKVSLVRDLVFSSLFWSSL